MLNQINIWCAKVIINILSLTIDNKCNKSTDPIIFYKLWFYKNFLKAPRNNLQMKMAATISAGMNQLVYNISEHQAQPEDSVVVLAC